MTDDSYSLQHLKTMRYYNVVNLFLQCSPTISVELKLCHQSNLIRIS